MTRKKVQHVEAILHVRLKSPTTNQHAIEHYVRNAIQSHCGGMDPADEFFNLEIDSVKVKTKELRVVTKYLDDGSTRDKRLSEG